MTMSQSYYHDGVNIWIISREAAKAGHLRVVSSHRRSYGYALLNVRLGQAVCWYRYKRDAVARIEGMKARASWSRHMPSSSPEKSN
jgi:predicted metal-dependent hydrolase